MKLLEDTFSQPSTGSWWITVPDTDRSNMLIHSDLFSAVSGPVLSFQAPRKEQRQFLMRQEVPTLITSAQRF